MIASFSDWHRLQYFAPLREGLDFAATSHYSHMTWWSRFDRLQFQIYLDSSVALAMFSFLNVCLWLLNLLLKSVSHDPKYFLVSIPGQFTGAQYMVALSRQLPFRGHSLLTRQLQDFTDLSSPLLAGSQSQVSRKSIAKHSRKSILFNEGNAWVNKTNPEIDVAMGAYDGGEVYELVGIYLQDQLSSITGKRNTGLYRDDGLAVLRDTPGPDSDRLKKQIIRMFQSNGLQIRDVPQGKLLGLAE